MTPKQLREAAELSAELDAVNNALSRARYAKRFKFQMRGHGSETFESIGHSSGVSEDFEGSYALLAVNLREAAVSYFTFHRDRLTEQLKSLGVEMTGV